jgi:transcriptional regulator with XRE-family HTH domain
MDLAEKRRLARYGDITREAAAFRLRAARGALRPHRSQKAMADELGLRATTYASYETGDVFPATDVVRHFLEHYDVDFNFIMFGDWRRLPSELCERLFDAMHALETKRERRSNPG